MKHSQVTYFAIFTFSCILDSQESDIVAVIQKSFEHLNVRNGLQLESILVISDKDEKRCKGYDNWNFYSEMNLFPSKYLFSALIVNVEYSVSAEYFTPNRSEIFCLFNSKIFCFLLI